MHQFRIWKCFSIASLFKTRDSGNQRTAARQKCLTLFVGPGTRRSARHLLLVGYLVNLVATEEKRAFLWEELTWPLGIFLLKTLGCWKNAFRASRSLMMGGLCQSLPCRCILFQCAGATLPQELSMRKPKSGGVILSLTFQT